MKEISKPWEVTAPLRSEAALVSVIVVGTGRGTGAEGACSGTDDDPNKSCGVADGPDGLIESTLERYLKRIIKNYKN